MQPTHGPYGALRILPDDVAIGGLSDPEAAARRIAAWAGERTALDPPPGAGIESGEVAIGPWRGVFARAAPASADPPRGIVLRPAGEVRPALRDARGRGRRAELREEILLDSGPRHIHLRLSGHADTPELFAVLQAAARPLRPA